MPARCSAGTRPAAGRPPTHDSMATLKQQAYNAIRSRMTEGSLSSGERLSPSRLAKEMGISHIPVREALSQLHSEGLVEQKPRRGMFVRQLARRELVELMEFRKTLECHAAGIAARRITDDQLDSLQHHLGEFRGLKDAFEAGSANEESIPVLLEWMRVDVSFHTGILVAAGNQYFIKALNEADVMTRMFARRTDTPARWAEPDFVSGNYQVHHDVFSAIRRHDVKGARRAMAVHMNRARKTALARFDWLERNADADVPDFPESFQEEVSAIQRRSIEAFRKEESSG